jgi:hypothetical protein
MAEVVVKPVKVCREHFEENQFNVPIVCIVTRSFCLICKSSEAKKYYLQNKGNRLEYQKKYTRENKEKVSARAKLYNRKNKEFINCCIEHLGRVENKKHVLVIKTMCKYCRSDIKKRYSDKNKENYKEWRSVNKLRKSEYDKKRYELNKEKLKEYGNRYRMRAKDKIKMREDNHRAEASSIYIRKLYSNEGFRKNEIPQELIEARKNLILLKREVRSKNANPKRRRT